MSLALIAEHPSFDRSLSLTKLERNDWGEPTYPSHVVTASHAYRYIPVGELDAGQLRMLVGQSIGMPFLVHRLLEVLDLDPWVAGTFYEGDLMQAAVRAQNHLFWIANPALLERLLATITRMRVGVDDSEADPDTYPAHPLATMTSIEAEGLEFAFRRLSPVGPGGPRREDGNLLPEALADLRWPFEVQLRWFREPASLPTIWERVLLALDENPRVGNSDCQLLSFATNPSNDLFWLLHPHALARLLPVLESAALAESDRRETFARRAEELRWAQGQFSRT